MGSFIVGVFFKDRLAFEMIESLFKLKENGKKVENIDAKDVMIRNL
jgi:hypothetical protein